MHLQYAHYYNTTYGATIKRGQEDVYPPEIRFDRGFTHRLLPFTPVDFPITPLLRPLSPAHIGVARRFRGVNVLEQPTCKSYTLQKS